MSEASLQALYKSILPQTVKLIKNKLASISELKVEIRILGSKGIEDLIRHAIDISQAKGLISLKNYQDHAEMMLKFGQFFETDPQYSWVSINPPNETQKERWIRYLDFMHEAAEDFRGDSDDGWPKALKQMCSLTYDDLSGINSYSKVADFLAWIWPEKFKVSNSEGIPHMPSPPFRHSAH